MGSPRVGLTTTALIALFGLSCATAEEVPDSTGHAGYKSITGGAGGVGGAPFPGGGSSAGGSGSSDDGAAPCIPGDERSCYPGDPADLGVGICAAGTETCVGGAWSACTDAVLPLVEVCEGSADENCDGQIDEGCCTKTSYQKDTGLQSGNATVCCDSGDKLIDAHDCGVGDNHTHTVAGDCGTGSEGAGNNGSACVAITCEKSTCETP